MCVTRREKQKGRKRGLYYYCTWVHRTSIITTTNTTTVILVITIILFHCETVYIYVYKYLFNYYTYYCTIGRQLDVRV